jgi:hypothetical protein
MLWSISRAAAAKLAANTGFEATGEDREAGDGTARVQYEWSMKTRKNKTTETRMYGRRKLMQCIKLDLFHSS